MGTENLTSLVSRIFFVAAFVLLGVAVFEFASNLAGYTVLRGQWEASRLLEYAVVLLVFVMAMLLRQIRDARKAS